MTTLSAFTNSDVFSLNLLLLHFRKLPLSKCTTPQVSTWMDRTGSCFSILLWSCVCFRHPRKLPTYTVSFFPLFSCLIHVQRDTFVFGDELNGDVFFLWVVPILVIWRDCRPFWLHTTLLFSKQYKLRVLKNMGEYRGCNLKKASSQLCWNSDLTVRDHITLEAEQGRLWLHGSVCIHHTKTVLTLM